MFCQNCGNSLSTDTKFCNTCGQQVRDVAESPPPSVQEKAILPASISERFLNCVLDGIAVFFIFLFFILLAAFLPVPDAVKTGFFFLGLVFTYGYHLICEAIWQRTLGKVITKTKVVDRQGNKPGFLKILGRSLARYIPFEFFSFVFRAYPIGWHDSLSKTLVVSSTLTPEEVLSIDFAFVRKQKPGSMAGIILMVAAVVFIFVTILGFLSSIVLASLNTARAKAADASVKADMASVRLSAELYRATTAGYAGFCGSEDGLSFLRSAASRGGRDAEDYVCNDDNELGWAASVPLQGGNYWCVDAVIDPLEVARPLEEGEVICPVGIHWLTFTSSADGFSVLLPRTPSREAKDNLPLEGTNLTYSWRLYQARDDLSLYNIYVYIYSAPPGVENIDLFLEDYLNSFLASLSKPEVISTEYSYHGGVRALDFIVSHGEEMTRGRFVFQDQTVFAAHMQYYPEDFSQETYDAFISSLSIGE